MCIAQGSNGHGADHQHRREAWSVIDDEPTYSRADLGELVRDQEILMGGDDEIVNWCTLTSGSLPFSGVISTLACTFSEKTRVVMIS